jgi:hypothetical protein
MSTVNLPFNVFPGFTGYGLVSPDVIEMATVFNAEGVEALSTIPDFSTRWSDIGTRVTQVNLGQAKIPVQLTSILGFEKMDGERRYHPLNVAATMVKVAPYQLNLEWPIQFGEAGAPNRLVDYYGIAGLPNSIVQHARAHKADLLASLIIAGQTNSSLSMTASAYTLAQPGYATGLPLFSDGSTSGSTTHFSNPLDANSAQFSNLHLLAGKITDTDVMGTVMTNMFKRPHPSKKNMTMGLGVTDLIGPTNMLIPFYKLAVQTLSLAVGGSTYAAATSNIYANEMLKRAETTGPESMVGVNIPGLSPWRFWIAPQLDSHPYIVAHPTYQMWLAVCGSRAGGAWAEFGGPNTQYVPRITLLGDGTEEAIKSRKVRLLSDLDAGVAASLPHFVDLYFETTP